jgi:hypothetical protein
MVTYLRIPSQELFPTKGPVSPEQLIGRSDEIASLEAQLRGGSHQILAGPRRTGKTSACDATVARLHAQGFYVVAIDLFQVESLAALAERIVLGAFSNRAPFKRALPAIRRAGRKIGLAARITATLKHEFGTDIEFAFGPGADHKTDGERFEFALNLLEKLATADDHPVVLYLDEFQEIEASDRRFGNPDLITKMMRAILQRSPTVTCLFAGSIEHMLRDIFTTEKRAMFQFGSFVTLAPIDNDAWVDGLRKAYNRDKTLITDAALEILLTASAGVPRATMLLAQQSHLVAVEHGVLAVDASEVYQGIEYAMDAERPTHESEVVRIRNLRAHAFTVAQRIAGGEAPYGRGLGAKTVGRALTSLRDAGMVTQSESRSWQLVDPLLSRYLDQFSVY